MNGIEQRDSINENLQEQVFQGVRRFLEEQAKDLLGMPPLTDEEQKIFDETCGKTVVEKLLSGKFQPRKRRHHRK